MEKEKKILSSLTLIDEYDVEEWEYDGLEIELNSSTLYLLHSIENNLSWFSYFPFIIWSAKWSDGQIM